MAEAGEILVMSDGSIVTLPVGNKVHYRVEGVLTQVLDLTDLGIQARIGTTRQELTGAWLPMQTTGEVVPAQLRGRLAYESGRFTGLMSISSKNQAGTIIMAFRDRLTAPNYLEVQDPTGYIAQRLP